ncbi:hypothetical protein APY03_4043 [Variovorax sp. WDL1]|nr:hypothetical protein APY03_4043 [Variovorax sp. WDL1]
MTVIDVLGAQLRRGLQSGHAVLHAVMLLEARLQALQDVDRFLHGRLDHVDLLEATRQGRILLEDAAVLGEGGGADALERAAGQGGLQQVGCVQRPARGGAGTDQRMDLVDEEDRVRLVLERLEHALQALLEVAAVLGAGQQRAHVERVHVGLGQDLRHVALRDAPGQALGDRGLADAGLADQQRVVLAAAAQDLDHALDLVLAADQRIDLAVLRHLVEVLGELLQRGRLLVLLATAFFALGCGFAAALGGLRRVALLDAVGDEVHHVQARHALLVQVVDGVRVLLAEDRDQHVGAGDFLLAVARGLDVHDGALDHALETERRLGVHVVGTRHLRRVVLDEIGERRAQVVDVGRAGSQNFRGTRVVQQSEQKMLHRDELVALLPGFDKSHVQADFQFLGNHVISFCLAVNRFSDGLERDLFNRFTDALERMPGLVRRFHHLIDLCGRHVARINAADTAPVEMDLEHDLGGGLPVLVEELLDNDDHELHGRVVVIEHHDLIHLRRRGLLRAPLDHDRIAIIPPRRHGRGLGRSRGDFGSHEIHFIEPPAACSARVGTTGGSFVTFKARAPGLPQKRMQAACPPGEIRGRGKEEKPRRLAEPGPGAASAYRARRRFTCCRS